MKLSFIVLACLIGVLAAAPVENEPKSPTIRFVNGEELIPVQVKLLNEEEVKAEAEAIGPKKREKREVYPAGFLKVSPTSSAPASTSAASTTAAPASTTAAPATTSAAPAATSVAPVRTSAAPATTSAAPATTTSTPASTSAAPATTSAAPATTSAAPATTSAAPATTSAAPATTSAAPATTSAAPATTSAAPATTSAAPATTSAAPATTSAAPAKTSAAPATTSAAPATTTPAPSASTPAPASEITPKEVKSETRSSLAVVPAIVAKSAEPSENEIKANIVPAVAKGRTARLNNVVQPAKKTRAGKKYSDFKIIELESEMSSDGHYKYQFQSEDGITANQHGELKKVDEENSGESVEGSYSYTDDDGNTFSLTYTADENGYRPAGAHLPVGPPIPPAIARALEWAATAKPWVDPWLVEQEMLRKAREGKAPVKRAARRAARRV